MLISESDQLLLSRNRGNFRLDRISPSMARRIDLDRLWQRAIKQAAADLIVHGQRVSTSLSKQCPLQVEEILVQEFDFIATAEAIRRRLSSA